jgi:hypothetical protein
MKFPLRIHKVHLARVHECVLLCHSCIHQAYFVHAERFVCIDFPQKFSLLAIHNQH